MSGSPLAYPLTRGIDGESGGAADLQTDIMRFMAILGLCLVAIFSLVQSLPIEARSAQAKDAQAIEAPPPAPATEPLAATPEPARKTEAAPEPVPEPAPVPALEQRVTLTRPKWVSTFQPTERDEPAEVTTEQSPAADPETEGFTLRFESDHALTRLVANGQVGFYAMNASRAQRMTVSDSRISFWDASTPNAYHEMEATTVPRAVLDALTRTGADAGSANWGVTLPGKLSAQLDSLMHQHTGGALVIHADGKLELESH
jgi:hypothetical protein